MTDDFENCLDKISEDIYARTKNMTNEEIVRLSNANAQEIARQFGIKVVKNVYAGVSEKLDLMEVHSMTERVINTNGLQTYLVTLIPTEKVRVREMDRVVTLEPVDEREYDCPLLGAAEGSNLTVEKFLAMSREDKEFES